VGDRILFGVCVRIWDHNSTQKEKRSENKGKQRKENKKNEEKTRKTKEAVKSWQRAALLKHELPLLPNGSALGPGQLPQLSQAARTGASDRQTGSDEFPDIVIVPNLWNHGHIGAYLSTKDTRNGGLDSPPSPTHQL